MINNKKGEIFVNSLISIIISLVVMLLLFKCGSNLITQSDQYAESQMEKLDSTIKDIAGATSENQVTIIMGDDAYFAYFEPNAVKVHDNYATLTRPTLCKNISQSCFCYCDEFDYESVDRSQMMFYCTSTKEMICNSYDMKFKVPEYKKLYDVDEDDTMFGGFFLFNLGSEYLMQKDTFVGWGSVLRPFDVNNKERMRLEEDITSKVVTLCLRVDGSCSKTSY